MIGLVPVRSGRPVAGAVDVLGDAGGRALLAGDGTAAAAELLASMLGSGTELDCAELGQFEPARWADELAARLAAETVVVLPAVPDGRDLAPRLARRLGWPLLAGAMRVHAGGATLSRAGGRQDVEVATDEPFVATLVPGRDRPVAAPAAPAPVAEAPVAGLPGDEEAAVRLLEVLEPDPATADLAEAVRIVAAGGGLGGAAELAVLERVGAALRASVGATRVVTDAGLAPHDRQIGTTGVAVRPRLYLAFGISGAAQHVGGLGEPDHVVAVNTDPSCPMMAMADLALVADAPATLRALAGRLGGAP